MDVHIHIDDRIAGFLRRLFHRRVVGLVGLAALLVSAGLVYASSVAEFSPGQPISSSQMNTILNGLSERISALEEGGGGGGVSGYESVEEIQNIAPNNGVSEIVAACSPGKKVVGGGFAAPFPVRISVTRPLANDTGWRVLGTNPGDLSASVVVYAVCVDVATPLN